MATKYTALDDRQREFIARQRIFFTASAAPNTRVNVSPRSTDAFRVLGPNTVAYLDRTGSGNETSAHILAGGRVTIMFCAFEGPPMILRLHGKGRVLHRHTPHYEALLADAFGGVEPKGARQIVVVETDLVVKSCGYGVPLFEYQAERQSMDNWANGKGDEELAAYRREKNRVSLDGLPTGLSEEETADL
jgi:hypothetical protein